MKFTITIVESEDSVSTRSNSYSIPKTFTLYLSSGDKGMKLDIMDFNKKDMDKIASLIVEEAVENYKKEYEQSEFKQKSSVGITARSMARAIQFDCDRNRRKSRGRVVKRDTTNDDFAFLEIPGVGDLMIQDLGGDLQFTLYKHGYKKELNKFSISKHTFYNRVGSSEQAKPVLDKLLRPEE